MDYTSIPKALLYKTKSLDKLAMQHPLNAVIIKRLMKMDGWKKDWSIEGQILSCLNNAYYICTIMRLEYDATFREMSYQRIARKGYIEGNNTLIECATLSLVSLFIERSTPEWQQKLQEAANDLRKYAEDLIDRRKENTYGETQIRIVHLFGIPKYLSKELDETWILPDDFFLPRTIDEIAIYDLYRQDPTFNWDRMLWRMGEDDVQELIEALGKTQLEKALLIHSFWNDIYHARKELDGPIKNTWNHLNLLAKKFCPDYMEITELHKIPRTGIEFENRITELEDQVDKLKRENTELKERHHLSQEKDEGEDDEKEVEKLKEVLELDRILEDDNIRLQIDERIIFVSTALGVPWNSDMTNQTQLAKIIEHFSGDNYKSIRSRIVAINKEIKEENRSPGEGLSQGTKEAVNNVIGWLQKATRGDTNTPAIESLINEIKDVFLNSLE